MNKIIVLSAKSASGKDTIMKQLVAEEGFLPCVSHTTRPMREGEAEGREYYFVDQQDFIARKRNDEFVETRTYDTVQGQWFYGMSKDELNSRLEIAGIEVLEARINYLAYASEIASVMLRRQQADAIIAAREKIVEGAVGMVEMALNQLTEKNIVEFDTKSKAALVSNLLVVLCADEAAQPMLNTGVDNK